MPTQHHRWYRELTRSIRRRDSNKCLKCGTTERLVVHHIDGDHWNNDTHNLITLCNQCHTCSHVKWNRDKMNEYLYDLIGITEYNITYAPTNLALTSAPIEKDKQQ